MRTGQSLRGFQVVPGLIVTAHFRLRVAQRIGPEIDADFLAKGIMWAIDTGREDVVEFVGRVSKCGKRVFRFRLPDRRQFFAMVNTETRVFVTVLVPGHQMLQQGKNRFLLLEEKT